MGKAFKAVALVLIPVLFVFGVIRLSMHGWAGTLLPTYEDVLGAMQNFPDIAASYADAVETMNNGGFDGFLGFLDIVVVVISAPFQVIGWFFSTLFTI